MASGIRLITYESEVTLKSGPHGCSVMAAPPTTGAGLEHRRPQPGLGQERRRHQAVVAAADDHRIPLTTRSPLDIMPTIVPLPD